MARKKSDDIMVKEAQANLGLFIYRYINSAVYARCKSLYEEGVITAADVATYYIGAIISVRK